MANLEPAGGRVLDAQSVKLTFSLTVTFYLTKSENRTKKALTQLTIALSKGIIFAKKILIFCKKDAEISKINRAFVLKLHMCVNVHTKFQFSTITLTSSRQGVILPPSPTSKQSRKRSTQIRVKNMNKIYIQNIDQSYVN